MLFREKVLSEIIELKAKVSELDSTIQAQNGEIEQLKSEHERLRCVHISGNHTVSSNDDSSANSRHPTDQADQDKNETMDSKITDTDDVTIQEVLNTPSPNKPCSCRSAAASTRVKQTEKKRDDNLSANNIEARNKRTIIHLPNNSCNDKSLNGWLSRNNNDHLNLLNSVYIVVPLVTM